MVTRLVVLRLALVAAICLALLSLALVLLGWWMLHAAHPSVAGQTHELGQFLGLAPLDAPTPMGVYRPRLTGVPAPLQPAVSRLLHIESWVWGLVLLGMTGIVGMLGFDWALGPDERAPRDRGYL